LKHKKTSKNRLFSRKEKIAALEKMPENEDFSRLANIIRRKKIGPT
jgi:hypothetical protein